MTATLHFRGNVRRSVFGEISTPLFLLEESLTPYSLGVTELFVLVTILIPIALLYRRRDRRYRYGFAAFACAALAAAITPADLFSMLILSVAFVAVILRHLGGNLRSRWTDFLTSDGEKPERDRDAEFMDWAGDRQSLLDQFNVGWSAFESALATIDDDVRSRTIYIRGEAHSVAQALLRSVTHVTYHVGQMAIVARMVHQGDWKWLTVAPGQSASHNQRTWGTAGSRSILSRNEESR